MWSWGHVSPSMERVHKKSRILSNLVLPQWKPVRKRKERRIKSFEFPSVFPHRRQCESLVNAETFTGIHGFSRVAFFRDEGFWEAAARMREREQREMRGGETLKLEALRRLMAGNNRKAPRAFPSFFVVPWKSWRSLNSQDCCVNHSRTCRQHREPDSKADETHVPKTFEGVWEKKKIDPYSLRNHFIERSRKHVIVTLLATPGDGGWCVFRQQGFATNSL